MFNLSTDRPNTRTFYLKDTYRPEETFRYELRVYNNIKKTGFTIDIQDVNPWISGLTNQTELVLGDKTVFYTGNTPYLSSFPELSFVFGNQIQISGVNYTFTNNTDINYTKSCKLDGRYVIAFNDNGGKVVVVDTDGSVVTGFTFSESPVMDLNIVPISTNKIVLGWYDTVGGISLLKEVDIVGNSIKQWSTTMFWNGRIYGTVLNKISDTELCATYRTSSKGVIQLLKLGNDHLFSVGYPFVFNDDITLFHSSVFQNDNIIVIYYDLDDQLKVRNCRIYDDYIGMGLTHILKNNYCYDLGIGVLDDRYVYVSYYDGEDMVIYTSLLLVEDDITIVENEVSVVDWNEGLTLTTIDDGRYMLSYTDTNINGVYRYVELSGTSTETLHCDYNEFVIDISTIDTDGLRGHNNYDILYNNEVVESGILHIEERPITYNI